MKRDMFKMFPITCICRKDLKSYLTEKEIENFTDNDMKYLASKIANAYIENSYWIDLEILAKDILENK